MKADRDDKAFPSLTSVVEFVERWNLLNQTKHQITCMKMNGSNPVPVAVCGTKMYWNMFLKVIPLLKLWFFSQIRTMSYKILSCLWVNVIMYHVRVNLRLLKFSNCAYLSWVFWVCNVFWGNNCNILISLYTCWAGSLLLWQRGYRPSAPPLSQHRGCVSPSN